MSSLGETDITIDSHVCGKVRLLHLFAREAVYPCLGLSVGFTLIDQSEPFDGASTAIGKFELRNLEGELRLAEKGSVVGRVRWSGQHHSVRSNNWAGESTVRLACDLDPARLEAIEQHRAEKPLILWLELWPTLVAGSTLLDSYLHPIRAEVPRDQWLAFLEQVRSVSFDVIEVAIPPLLHETFRRPLELVREARREVEAGNYTGAMALCRRVVEWFEQQLGGSEEDPLGAFFAAVSHEKAAKEYRSVVSRVKQLASYALHELGDPIEYSRAEVLFVVRTTESLLGLLASLSQRGAK